MLWLKGEHFAVVYFKSFQDYKGSVVVVYI